VVYTVFMFNKGLTTREKLGYKNRSANCGVCYRFKIMSKSVQASHHLNSISRLCQ